MNKSGNLILTFISYHLSYHLSYHFDVMHKITSRLSLDQIVATNSIEAQNPPLITVIFCYVAQIGECYFPFFWQNSIPLSNGNVNVTKNGYMNNKYF